ncbi:VWA domain-containing protein [Rubrivirga sp. IMCC45206]|uniref:VWA domain-containing protein n=1 Tax=Rubrivirga sp. IMCC45206 TaxID=3391614 RepID=UPI00398FBAA2
MLRLLRIAVLVVLAAVSGCYAVQASSDYYGIDTALPGEGVLFVVDVSGSMEGKQEGTLADHARGRAAEEAGQAVQNTVGGRVGRLLGGQVRGEATKLGVAKRELIPVIRGLDASTRFSVLTFGASTDFWRTSLVEASGSNKTLAMTHTNGLDANGGTPIRGALEAALATPGVTTVFLMTDGQPTDATPDDIVARTRTLNRGGVVIHTIGLGPDQDAAFLRALASANGGVYVDRR